MERTVNFVFVIILCFGEKIEFIDLLLLFIDVKLGLVEL